MRIFIVVVFSLVPDNKYIYGVYIICILDNFHGENDQKSIGIGGSLFQKTKTSLDCLKGISKESRGNPVFQPSIIKKMEVFP